MEYVPISERLVAAFIWTLTGSFTFFVIFNRFILQRDQGRSKTAITYTFLASITIGPFLCGFFTGLSKWVLIPLFVMLGYIFGEFYRKHSQRRHFGSRPREFAVLSDQSVKRNHSKSLVRREYRVVSDRLPALRIVQMTDFHLDDRFDPGFFRDCVHVVRELNPDILVLTGDFVNEARHTPLIDTFFRDLPGRLGVFASLGNHDYWAGAEAVRTALRSCGIHVVSGRCEKLESESGQPLMICGHEAPWGGVLSKETLGENPEIPKIVLCHTPDGIFDLQKHHVDLVFSGHLHGGQWRLPILGPLVAPSTHGRLLDRGHYRYRSTDLFVSAGLGVIWIPVRFNCPPEILVVDVVPSHPDRSPGRCTEVVCTATGGY